MFACFSLPAPFAAVRRTAPTCRSGGRGKRGGGGVVVVVVGLGLDVCDVTAAHGLGLQTRGCQDTNCSIVVSGGYDDSVRFATRTVPPMWSLNSVVKPS